MNIILAWKSVVCVFNRQSTRKPFHFSLAVSVITSRLTVTQNSPRIESVWEKGGKVSYRLKDAMCQRAGLFTLENVHAKFHLKFDYTHPLSHAKIKQHSWLAARWPIFLSKPVKRSSPAGVWHNENVESHVGISYRPKRLRQMVCSNK